MLGAVTEDVDVAGVETAVADIGVPFSWTGDDGSNALSVAFVSQFLVRI